MTNWSKNVIKTVLELVAAFAGAVLGIVFGK